RVTARRYPPGSVMKTLTAAAALDTGVLNGTEAQVTCPNQLVVSPSTPPVRNAVDGLSGTTGNPSDLRRVYAFSCNTAFAQIGLMLGAERLAAYAFGMGLVYGDSDVAYPDIRDISADVGTIASTADVLNYPSVLADTAYGQGQALIRPLDMLQMVALIGNNGNMMRPYVVAEVRRGEEQIYQAQPEVVRRVISAQTASQMRSIMKTSVDIGYAQPAALPYVGVGGKTGTAETSSGVPHSWFVGLVPIEQPRYAVAVIIENSGEGSVYALPVARRVLEAAIPPPPTNTPTDATLLGRLPETTP
ncbi:MAG: penicillin-binding protein 2, partial [Chloroflexaceae bacterium]|nr:penicillin-binding protein 2 [Chloroflexaceae bacterium]